MWIEEGIAYPNYCGLSDSITPVPCRLLIPCKVTINATSRRFYQEQGTLERAKYSKVRFLTGSSHPGFSSPHCDLVPCIPF